MPWLKSLCAERRWKPAYECSAGRPPALSSLHSLSLSPALSLARASLSPGSPQRPSCASAASANSTCVAVVAALWSGTVVEDSLRASRTESRPAVLDPAAA